MVPDDAARVVFLFGWCTRNSTSSLPAGSVCAARESGGSLMAVAVRWRVLLRRERVFWNSDMKARLAGTS